MTLEGHTKEISCLAIFPDNRIVSGSDDNTLIIWNLFTQDKIVLRGHTRSVTCIIIMDDYAISGANDKTIKIKSVLNNTEGISVVSKCEKIIKYKLES